MGRRTAGTAGCSKRPASSATAVRRQAVVRFKAVKASTLPKVRSELNRQRLLDSAKAAIATCPKDPEVWPRLLAQPDIADYLRRSLALKAAKDLRFARLVSQVITASDRGLRLPATSTSLRSFSFASSPEAPLLSPEAMASARPGPGVRDIALLLEPIFCVANRDLQQGRLFAPRLGLCGSHAPARPAAVSSAAQPLPSAEPLLKRRRRRSKGAPTSPQARLPMNRGILGILSAELVALTMSYVDIKTKVRGARAASKSVLQAMQCRACWDPLSFDQATGRAFLRLLKRRDPLGCFTDAVNKTKRMLPQGFFDVTRLEAVLMDPERVELEQSDTEDDTPKPRPLVIADPLDEVCKRLRNYFVSASELYITNIEDYRMDYRFVSLRSGSLSEFGFVELVHCPTTPPTYSLLARRKAPPRLINLEAMKNENRARMPQGVIVDVNTTISEREALYLAEHRSAYKNGEDFHLVHAFYRTVRSHGVRKRYKAVVESLRRRFPQQFTSSVEAASP